MYYQFTSSKTILAAVALLAMAFLALGCTGTDEDVASPPGPPEPSLPTMADYMTPQEKRQERIKERQERIKEHFNSDGSHTGLTDLILSAMDNPKSYEHVETRYIDKGNHLLVMTVFRGTNKFGGIVKSTIVANVDLNGNVVEIISQSP